MSYTVKQLSLLAGVSVPTLHYYDEIGLLKPSFVKDNGYRFYEDAEVSQLQQILFFREIEFPLEKIIKIMNSPGYDAIGALADQQKLLELKQQRIEKLLRTIDKTIKSLKGGESMSNDDKYSAFNDPTYQKHKAEVEQKWGQTDAYKQSVDRVGKMTKADMDRIKAEAGNISSTIASLMNEGNSVDSVEVQKQMDRFYKHLHNFYDPSYELFKGLGEMYVSDSRFTEVYEKQAKGLAVFMRDAMAYYAHKHKK